MGSLILKIILGSLFSFLSLIFFYSGLKDGAIEFKGEKYDRKKTPFPYYVLLLLSLLFAGGTAFIVWQSITTISALM